MSVPRSQAHRPLRRERKRSQGEETSKGIAMNTGRDKDLQEVWVIQCDHEPMIIDGELKCFPASAQGTRSAREFLNYLHAIVRPLSREAHYFDAVLYAPKPEPAPPALPSEPTEKERP